MRCGENIRSRHDWHDPFWENDKSNTSVKHECCQKSCSALVCPNNGQKHEECQGDGEWCTTSSCCPNQLARPGVDHAIQGKTERMMIKNVVLMGALNLIAVTLAATFCLQMTMTLHVTQDMSCVMKAIGTIHTPEGRCCFHQERMLRCNMRVLV